MNYFERYKRELATLIAALENEFKKQNPMPHYLFEKIEAIQQQTRILKNNID